MRFLTGGHTVDLDGYEITGPAGAVSVEPQVFDVVALLLRHRDRAVTKEELLDTVWGSRFVSESVLTSRIKSARRALGDDGTAQAVIRTVRSRGYRWVAPVEQFEPNSGAPSGEMSHTATDVEVTDSTAALPIPLEPILGRDTQIDELTALMTRSRVNTIVGPGGVGKTRLGLELLRRRTHEQPPAHFVPLAPVRDPEAAAIAVADAIGIRLGQHPDIAAACQSYLANRPRLLVVDNCEHVLAAISEFLNGLLLQCSGLSVLCTSRQPIGLADEQVTELGPLPVPDADSSATAAASSPSVQLFLSRAKRAGRSFTVDDTALTQARSLCRALDGLPLAIELAAGRSAALGLPNVLERLDRRLDLLSSDRPGVDNRHRSLRATLAWSYELLDPDARVLFRHLSVFPGGFDLSTAEQVAAGLGIGADPATVVARLVEASMLVHAPATPGTRFTQLETVRAFGIDELSQLEQPRALEMLASWALDLAAASAVGVQTADEPRWDTRLRREMSNLRAARRYLTDQRRFREVADLLRSLDGWAQWRDMFEIWSWETELLAAVDPTDADLRQTALALALTSNLRRGQLDLAASHVKELFDSTPTGWPLSHALHMGARLSLFRGRPQEASDQWLRRRTIAECPEVIPESTAWAAMATGYAGDISLARDLASQARREADGSGSPTARARAAYATGEIEHCAGSGREQPWLEQAITLATSSGAHFISGVAMVTLASGRAAADDPVGAAIIYRSLIGEWVRTGTWTQQWTTLRNAAELLVGFDDATAAQIWVCAHADRSAARMDGPATAREQELRAGIAVRVGAAQLEKWEQDARTVDRSILAERVSSRLQDLIDRDG